MIYIKKARNKWVLIGTISLFLIFIIGQLLPFLPGPSSLIGIVQGIFLLIQLTLTFLAGLAILVAVVWMLIEIVRLPFKKIRKINQGALIWLAVAIVSFIIIWLPNGLLHITDFARNHAIRNSQPIITAIEHYKDRKGVYPQKLEDMQPEFITQLPETGIMGIKAFDYDIRGNSYELSFIQNINLFINYEVVIYSPTDQHKAEGELQKLYDTGFEHWRYYIYD